MADNDQVTSQDNGTGGSTGSTSTTQPAVTTTPAQSTSTTPSTSGAAQPAKPTGYTYTEDRGRWIPPHRLAEETTKRERLSAELEQTRRQLQALAGVAPQDPGQAKTDQVREAVMQLFPQLKHLSNLTDDQMQRLLAAPDMASRAEEIEAREHSRYAKTQLDRIYESVAQTLGSDTLSDDQKNDLTETFKSWFARQCQSEIQASGGESSATLTRYENGDPSLLNEFVKRYTDSWIEPARRRVTAQTTQRTRPVPNSMGRSQVTSVQKPEKFNSLDERIEWAAKLAAERGVNFNDR